MQSADDFGWLVPMEVMMGALYHPEVQACSISTVPEELRDPRVEYDYNYKPKVISIGLLHKGSRRQLQSMEELKWEYMCKFLSRQGTEYQNRSLEERFRECGNAILKLDKVVRASYGGNIESEAHEIAKIMILDGCFLLEFLHNLRDYMNKDGNLRQITVETGDCNIDDEDPIFEDEETLLLVLNDITMFENQMPFIVLKKLYRKVFPYKYDIEQDHRVANIVLDAFDYSLINPLVNTPTPTVAHILHLMHSTIDQENQQTVKRAKQELLRCATKLRAAGIIIIGGNLNNQSQTQKQLKFKDIFNLNINFDKSSGNLVIPTLYVKETTEVKWRNLIAWEQSSIWTKCKYTSYAQFFNGLICCKHDIELLMKKGVIVNMTKKSKEDLLALFKTTGKGAERMDSSYSNICEDLNKYNRRKVTKALREFVVISWHVCRRVVEILVYYWQNWLKILLRDHIPTVWKFVGVLSALALLALTITQTIYTIRGVK